jgi:crotonobetainyl-CoA:carnitine CoA-transferase CaiB-like acyl-CoA transferase
MISQGVRSTSSKPGCAYFLEGVKVLEIGDGIAGGAATAVLAAYGADVTAVLSPDATVHRVEPLIEVNGQTDSFLSLLLRIDKEVVGHHSQPDPREFDIVVVDRIEPSQTGLQPDVETYLDYVAAANKKAWVTISPFGLSGPQRDWRVTDFVLSAVGGILDAVTDPDLGRPVGLPGHQALLTTGQMTALAACYALDRAQSNRRPEHVEISGQEAVVATGPVLPVIQALLNAAAVGGVRRIAPAEFVQCRDGLVYLMCSEEHQWAGLVKVLGEPAWTSDYRTTADRLPHKAEILERLNAAFSTWEKDECERALQQAGVPVTVVRGASELLKLSQLESRHALAEFRVGDVPFRAVLPTAQTAVGKERATTAPIGIRGLRIAEAGHVLAVPMAGALLGAMGAEVTKLEDLPRLDTYRRKGPYIDDLPGIDRSAYFSLANHSKRSLAMDMTTEGDRLGDALNQADVVIENFGRSRSRRLGFDADILSVSHPELLAVSVSGFGHTGPFRDYRAYAYGIHSSCGLIHLVQSEIGGHPVQVNLAWADLVCAVSVATAVAAWAVGKGSTRGASIDLSMVEIAAQRFNEFLAAESFRSQNGDQGSTHPVVRCLYAPQASYLTGDGRWIALSASSDSEWNSIVRILGSPTELRDSSFGSMELRVENKSELDSVLGGLISSCDGAELAAELQSNAVAAAIVSSPSDLVADEHLRSRGFFGEVDHSQWGKRRLIGLPWRPAGGPPIPLVAPPELGDMGIVSINAGP